MISHSSSSIAKMPDNGSLRCDGELGNVWDESEAFGDDGSPRDPESNSTTAVLSGNSSSSQGISSRLYSAASCSKITSLKYCCNNSFVKLMHNCSSEFFSKNSNPKMSRTPTKGGAPAQRHPSSPASG